MKLISYFLPQFYPTPENDKYWGKDFTDWVNVKKAKPLFKGHKQPLLPLNNDFYDLSDLKVLEEHCQKSIDNGIDGFGYWHYWFDSGNKTLEKVQEMHLNNKHIKQNFFFAWANTNWTKSWVGDDKVTIFKQEYSKQSAIDHFEYLKDFITDDRYIKYKDKPMFQVLNPHVKEAKNYILLLEKMALETFGKGFFWVFPVDKDIAGLEHLDFSLAGFPPGDVTGTIKKFKIKRHLQRFGFFKGPVRVSQESYLKKFKINLTKILNSNSLYFPCVLTGWDNTPRYKERGFVIDGDISTFVKKQLDTLKEIKQELPEIVFIKAWNEWAEGNVVEPYVFDGKTDFPINEIKKFK